MLSTDEIRRRSQYWPPCRDLLAFAVHRRELVEEALGRIATQPARHVYAGRRGVVAGYNFPGSFSVAVAFRRVGDLVRVEFWFGEKGDSRGVDRYALEPDLQRRAAAVLDSL